MPSVLFAYKAGPFYFCCSIITCMEGRYVGVIYSTLLASNDGDLSPYTLQTTYFSNINEKNISDRENIGELLLLGPR